MRFQPDRKQSRWLFGGIVALGAFLRVWGIGFGLPIKSSLYIRPDESLLVQPALHLLERWGDPLFYVYPGLVIEMTALFSHIYFQTALLLGWTEAPGMVQDFAAGHSAYFMIPRWISAAAAILTIILVYRLADRLTGDRRLALLASLFYALAPLAVRDAHFGVTDNVMVLFLTASLLAGVSYASGQEGPARAGALFGLAAASKYTAFLLGPRLVAAVILRERGAGWVPLLKRIAAVTILPAAFFVFFNPYVIPNWETTRDELLNILEIFYLWQPGDPPWTLSEGILQILRPLRFGPGGMAGVGLATVGLGGLLLRKGGWKSPAILPVGYFLLHLLALFPFRHTVPYRYLLPVLPLTAIFASVGFRELLRIFDRKTFHLAAWALLAFSLASSAFTSFRIDQLLARTDTRTLAGDWIEQQVDPSVPIIVLCPPEAEPQIYESRDSIVRRTRYVRKRYGEQAGEFISRLYLDQLEDPRRTTQGWQLYRSPAPGEVEAPVVAVVTCSHPLRMGQTSPGAAAQWSGTTLEGRHFVSCPPGMKNADWDWIDALFLPFTRLDEVERPGPNIDVRMIRRDPSPQQADSVQRRVPKPTPGKAAP